MTPFVGIARRVANKSTKAIGIVTGPSAPYIYVAEYPKSGGTWLCRMVADALDLPFPQNPVLPLGFPCVVHNHWRYNPRLRRAFYLYRDGRDVMVSFFFHRMRSIASREEPAWRHYRDAYDHLFGKGYDPQNTQALLPKFIEHEFRKPRGARLNWKQHIDSWFDPKRPTIAFLRYEDLLADCPATLTRAITRVTGAEPDRWRIDWAVEKYAMARQTGRKPGQENTGHFIRKGVAGDWKNHFTRESAQVFHDLAGDTLIQLGYEPDAAWIEQCPGDAPVQEPTVNTAGQRPKVLRDSAPSFAAA